MLIQGYEPKSFFENFEAISLIPRGSGKEEKISAFLCKWAEEHGIGYTTDEAHNVFMKRPASAGYESRPAVLLQGHMDMVCEKNAATVHDFEKDPIRLIAEGEWLRADGTTLGGDDGFAVAMMMSLLTEPIPHPALECLFTTDEEVGMSGANRFDYSQITAEKMINLDSEEEGVATVSCAGGARMKFSFSFDRVAIPKCGKCLKVTLSGLAGGHSGSDIALQRMNANNTLGRLLSALYERYPFHLLSMSGGNMDNAITRECTAYFFTSAPEESTDFLKNALPVLKGEATKPDKGLKLRVEKAKAKDLPSSMLTLADTSRFLDTILFVPTGVNTRCPSKPDLVESSANLGILRLDSEGASMTYLARSSSEARMNEILHAYERIAKRMGAETKVYNRYPGWEMNPDSALQKQFLAEAREVFGRNVSPRIEAIHAGLECGVIISAVSHPLDGISIGPDLRDIHTPDERMNLRSCERLWKLVTRLLEKA